jgi:SAM-dependent methyltransferase
MTSEEQPLTPRRGYDLIAPHYEAWHWSELWRQNEEPLIHNWLEALAPGVGLDAGAGTGRYAEKAESLGHRCAALDISLQMLRTGRARIMRRTGRPAILFVEGDIKLLPFGSAYLDWALCSRVLSHIPDLVPVFQELAWALTGGAECLISDVHPDHPYSHVNLDVENRNVVLDTFKHSLQHIVAAATGGRRFELLGLNEFYFDDLPVKPPLEGFAKLYRQPNPAVFYICRFRRRDE